MYLPLLPVWITDLLGSALMIGFSFLSVRLARRLRAEDQNNVVWTYLLWLCYGLAAFAVSRSVGHIAKRFLLSTHYEQAWSFLQPYSGSINTLMFAVVASITLFFERIWGIYRQILGDKQALQEAHEKLLFLNRNLENLVAERTRELSISEQKYRRIFEASQDMILVADREGWILDVNNAGRRLLGMADHQECIGREQFQEFFEDPRQWQELYRDIQAEGFVVNKEIDLKRRGGQQFQALLSGKAETHGATGAVEAIYFLVKDISQRKAMERQLLLADKMASIGQLAAGVAHEINNPLGMILGYTQLLIRGEEKGSQRHTDLRTIEKHARACKTIVGDLLSFSRSTETRKEPGHVNGAIEEVLKVLQHHFELDGIGIEISFDERVPPLVLDREKIKQVFMNLLMNARQAIGKKGAIALSTHYDAQQHQVQIRVSDNGCGIEPQFLTRIFDPFFTTKATGEGTGLGLSVSYGIIKDHGGDIVVSSDPGAGSTFTVILPETPAAVQEQS